MSACAGAGIHSTTAQNATTVKEEARRQGVNIDQGVGVNRTRRPPIRHRRIRRRRIRRKVRARSAVCTNVHIDLRTLAGIRVFFPDPWPKKRHHKRRIVQPPFVQLVARKLQPGGEFHLATDWENYAEQMLEVLSAEPMLSNTHDGYAPRPDFRPLTKFENRGLRLGHGVWDLIFTRNDTPTHELNWPKKEQ